MFNPGDTYTKTYTVLPGHTVPDTYPESEDFLVMPAVFSTGFLVGLMEWACIEHLKPYLDEGLISLGLAINVTHDGPCTTGTPLLIQCVVVEVGKRSACWRVVVETVEGGHVMGQGMHKRVWVNRDVFVHNVNQATAIIGGESI